MAFLNKELKKPDPGPIASALLAQTEDGSPSPPPFFHAEEATNDRPILPFHLSVLTVIADKADWLWHLIDTYALRSDNSLTHDLLASGQIDEMRYFAEAARRLGVPFLCHVPVAALHPFPDEVLLEGIHDLDWVMMWPPEGPDGQEANQRSQLLCAPKGEALDRLEHSLQDMPDLRQRICLTVPSVLQAAQRAAAKERALTTRVYQLKQKQPDLSAHKRIGHFNRFVLVSLVFAAIALAFLFPPIAIAFNILSIMVFLSIAGLRIAARLAAKRLEQAQALCFEHLFASPIVEEEWPSYTVLVPLYKEASILGDLICCLTQLDYPRDKVSIQLLVEADDHETWQALAGMKLPPAFTVVSVPIHGPRTKPKALNYALAFVKSELVVIYDAEDRPNPLQLKEAAMRMRVGGETLACLQGRLAIDNGNSRFLSRQFAVEYAALFDGFLPYLADKGLPVPLGGTSNHFRTDILKAVGGWDPYNVTEDADLGLRLTRLGYRIEVLQTETWEEAPESYPQWVRQRTRWFKGWMQTWLVHMRNPLALWRSLGTASFLTFQSIIGGMLISALIHPVYILSFALTFLALQIPANEASSLFWSLVIANSVNLLLGYGGAMSLGYRKARQRYGYGLATILAMPVYWLMMTPAAWRALVQLLDNPHHWEKTEHGLSLDRPSLDSASPLGVLTCEKGPD
ncbi:glycosyltransferase [Cohaesibacter sp. CAU 1516]|uniref:glycosyltransferase family 2 protein n=1 Tax=Cohaesibacter sp. CAU 1516 TaxID=2576038 RepID=UPI0010FE97DE|nr:glycosyltransferase family 2 protein [Cohaesibacter sp. CAU 1516]TLP43781.1 glycosyltransferase [Cohaesibacter sp. CAU 1516]